MRFLLGQASQRNLGDSLPHQETGSSSPQLQSALACLPLWRLKMPQLCPGEYEFEMGFQYQIQIEAGALASSGKVEYGEVGQCRGVATVAMRLLIIVRRKGSV
jgi:hypothetical protein